MCQRCANMQTDEKITRSICLIAIAAHNKFYLTEVGKRARFRNYPSNVHFTLEVHILANCTIRRRVFACLDGLHKDCCHLEETHSYERAVVQVWALKL
jgi:hypothetical protein